MSTISQTLSEQIMPRKGVMTLFGFGIRVQATHIAADAFDPEPPPRCKGKATFTLHRTATTSALVPDLRKTSYGWV